MKKLLLSFCLIILPMLASADAVEINGIYYILETNNKTAEVTSNPNKYKGEIIIPSFVLYESLRYDVTKISMNAFSSNIELTSITIPNTIQYIGTNAFYGCIWLTAVNISDLTAWCNIAFAGSVYGDTNPLCSAKHLFLNGKEIKELVIPSGVTRINPWAFVNCVEFTSVTIPSSVTEVCDLSFSGCEKLNKVQIEDLSAWCNISFSQQNVFNLNSNPLTIAHHLYLNDEEITNLEIPNNVVAIKDYAFYGCEGLISITIPSSVTSIGYSAFSNCNDLSSVTIPSAVKSIGKYAFSGCKVLNSLNIPNGVLSIEEGAFLSCESMTSISIPNSVTLIDNMAFSGCKNLSKVIIGNNVKFINYNAFNNCISLSDVYCFAENVPNTNTNAFKDSNLEYATLHVPVASLNYYLNAEPWKIFQTKVAIESGEIPEVQKCATPTIKFENGVVKFSCATEGAEFVSTITPVGDNKKYDSEIVINNTYKVTVYSTKVGYNNSDPATIEIQANSGVKGDLNSDGVVNVADHVELSKIIIGK